VVNQLYKAGKMQQNATDTFASSKSTNLKYNSSNQNLKQ